MNHIDALNLRLSNERVRLAQAKNANEIRQRQVWITQIEKEIESEKAFLNSQAQERTDLSDEELLRQLEA